MHEMKNEFKDVIRQIEVNEVYQMDKLTQILSSKKIKKLCQKIKSFPANFFIKTDQTCTYN
jgi:hypothetical protein